MKDGYAAVLLEDIAHKFEAILEGQILLAPMSQKLNDVDECLGRVEADVKIVKKALPEHSREASHHEQRIDDQDKCLARLEQAV